MTDPRITLARPGLAPRDLEGVVAADAYAKLQPAQCRTIAAPMRAAPDPAAEQVSQLLFGERFDILRREGDFAWGQALRDGYVGWIDSAALSLERTEPSHRVFAPRAPVLAESRIRAACVGVVAMNALVQIGAASEAFSHAEGLGWVATCQIAPIGSGFRDPVEAATLFVGAPYVWGGRDGGAGLDCSGLVQQALHAAGMYCPRDADQQAALGVEIRPEFLGPGDLVAWRGHIGMMLDAERLIHANAHHMAVAIEPLEIAVSRIAQTSTGQPTAFRRLDCGPPRL